MKLDSEEQREELLKLLGTIQFTVTAETVSEAQAKIESILAPIREAGIEAPESPSKDG